MTTYLTELEKQPFFGGADIEGSVRWYINWYRKHADGKRLWFRRFGVITLIASISLPFILFYIPDESKPLVATGGAWIIALAGGLNGFFQFNKSWQNYIETQYRLEHLLTNWELECAAQSSSNDPDALKNLHESARTFVESARAAITDETKSYFEEVKFPNLNIEGK
jgi:hypothetical protein